MEEDKKRTEEEKRKRQRHLRRKSTLRKNGVSTQNAELLPLDPGEEMPTPIVLDLEDDSADEVFTQVPSWQTSHLEFLRTN